MKALLHRGAQFEGDALWNIQPVQFIMEDVSQTPIEFPCSSNDLGGGVEDALQLVSRSS